LKTIDASIDHRGAKNSKISENFDCRKTDENDLFVELDNNKQVEYRVKSPKFVLHVFQYYYLKLKCLTFFENFEIL
jgi:hypothetical protein